MFCGVCEDLIGEIKRFAAQVLLAADDDCEQERLTFAVSEGLGFVVEERRQDREVMFVTEKVDRGPVTPVVTATGTVNPVKTVLVGTYVSGPILEIDVDFNSPVTQGQRLAKIDPGPFQMKVRQAAANVASVRARAEKARADLDLKRRNLARARELARRETLAESALDLAQSEVAQAEAQLALDRAAVRQAEAGLEEALDSYEGALNSLLRGLVRRGLLTGHLDDLWFGRHAGAQLLQSIDNDPFTRL